MADGKLVASIVPAGKQERRHVAETIKARLRGRNSRLPFHYKDAGSLATIGKRAAVVDFAWVRPTGRLAW